MLTQVKYNGHRLQDSNFNYAGESQELYSILHKAFYLWNGLALVVDPKLGRRQQISIRTQKVVEHKKLTTTSTRPPL